MFSFDDTFSFQGAKYRLLVSYERIDATPKATYSNLPISFEGAKIIASRSYETFFKSKEYSVSEISLMKNNFNGNLSYKVSFLNKLNQTFHIAVLMDGKEFLPKLIQQGVEDSKIRPKGKDNKLLFVVDSKHYLISVKDKELFFQTENFTEIELPKILATVRKQFVKDFPAYSIKYYYSISKVNKGNKYFFKIIARSEPMELITYYVVAEDKVISPKVADEFLK